MSAITAHPTRLTTVSRRAAIVGEAVVSKYIHDISRPQHPRERAVVRRPCLPPLRTGARTSPAARERGHGVSHRRRTALELSA